jgi:bifunctional non-homologous end joining protein LigD
MLLHKADVMFSAPDWTYEPKWDGFRVMAAARDGHVRLVSRNGHSFTRLFGPVAEVLRGFPVSILLDGEAIVINDRGQPDFEALQSRLRPSHGSLPGICYMVFDCLYVNGHSLLTKPLEKRQAILRELQRELGTDAVKLTEGFPAEKSKHLMKVCASMGLEGVVMKRKGSLYRPGFRSPDWIKVPIRHREEFVVCGYVANSTDHLGSLMVGQYDREGNLAYAGVVGTGLSNEMRLVIFHELEAHQRKTCPFSTVPDLRDHFRDLRTHMPVFWVKPRLIVEVEYRQRQQDRLRHATLKGVRPEKKPGVIRRSAMTSHDSY